MLIRRYGTMPKARRARVFFEVNQEKLLIIGLGIGSTVTTAMVSDNFYAYITGQTGLLTRLFTSYTLGWYTPDPKAKRYAHTLTGWGIDPTTLVRPGSRELDLNLVKEAYLKAKHSRFPRPISKEIAELVERAEAQLLEREKLDLEIKNLNDGVKELKDQIASLQNPKESDLI